MKKTTPMFEIRKVANFQTEFPQVKIKTSKDAHDFISQFYGDDIEVYESFFILLLNFANKTIGYAKISQGGMSGTVVDGKIVAKYAVEALASGVILAHNHPSGNTQPSQADIDLTKKMREGLKNLDIQVLDHIILCAEEKYLSLADENYL